MYSDPTGTSCETHGCYYVPSCTVCNPDLADLHAERGKYWAHINMLPHLYCTNKTVSINGSVSDGTALIYVTINVANANKKGELDPNIHIENSCFIRSQKAQEQILDLIVSSEHFDASLFTRDKESWIAEWNGHNYLYKNSSNEKWKRKAQHVDLNEKENRPWGLFW